jgi:hypothetical protein
LGWHRGLGGGRGGRSQGQRLGTHRVGSSSPSTLTLAMPAPPPGPQCAVPVLTHWQIFTLFLSFGIRAFGGPVASIANIKQQLVVEQRWIPVEKNSTGSWQFIRWGGMVCSRQWCAAGWLRPTLDARNYVLL